MSQYIINLCIFLIIVILSATLIIYFCKNPRYSENYRKNKHLQIYGGMVTIPSRKQHLDKVIASIIKQVDHLYVHLNYDREDKIPTCLNHPKITITHANQYGDLGDTGKFLSLCKNGFSKNCYSATFDDDIIYPDAYISKCIKKAKKYNNKVIISHHGGILNKYVKNFAAERNLIHFQKATNKDTWVNICGTGVTVYPPNLLKLTIKDFERPNTSDLFVAIAAQKQKVPMIVIKHKQNLFGEIEYSYTLWRTEIDKKSDLHNQNTQTAKKIEWTLFSI